MTPALDAALQAFARRDRVLVAVDFDGTLAEIVEDPQAARALPAAAAALARLAGLDGVHIALVSGRALADLRRLADPPAGAVLVGSHGAELALPGLEPAQQPAPADLLGRLERDVRAIIAVHPGTAVEVKPTSVVLHTRTAQRAVARAATVAALAGPAREPGVQVTEGKEVVELAVTDATKGRALAQLRAPLGLPGTGGVLYAGDDVTDERAFAVLDDDAGDLTIKVGLGTTSARHRVAGPAEVAVLLARLAALREDHSEGRRGSADGTARDARILEP